MNFVTWLLGSFSLATGDSITTLAPSGEIPAGLLFLGVSDGYPA